MSASLNVRPGSPPPGESAALGRPLALGQSSGWRRSTGTSGWTRGREAMDRGGDTPCLTALARDEDLASAVRRDG